MSRVAYTVPEPVQIEARSHLARAIRMALFAAQDGICETCKGSLTAFEVDHRLALALGGQDQPHNLRALCPPCHKIKTAADKKAIAKAKRLERDADPATRRKSPRPLKSRPFPKREMA